MLALAAACGGCITDRILVDDGHGGLVADPQEFARVEAETAARRRLPFSAEVPADVMTVKQLRAWFDRYADARKAELEKEDRFFHRTNILPPTVSTAQAYKGFLADFVGGVYDDSTKRMILVSDYAWWAKLQQDAVGWITGRDWAYEVFLAHELTHALQDQHFGLGDMLKGGVYDDNDDAAFVRKTILETEANVVGMSHFLGMDLEKLATRKAFFLFMRYNNLLNGPLLMALSGRTPSYFAKQAFSQYELGLSFVEQKLDDGGMDELSRAYVRVPGTRGAFPESTEQLLWPRKMRSDSLDRPIPIARLKAPPAALPGSSLVVTNVFGALAFKHWLDHLEGPLVGGAVADGWGGDRWDIIDDPSACPPATGGAAATPAAPARRCGASVLVWRTTWDSDDDAAQFFDAYSAAVPERYGERAAVVAGSSDTRRVYAVPAAPKEEHRVRTTRDERVLVERRGRDVLVVEGTAPAALAPLATEMWTQLVRGAPPAIDEDKLAGRRAALDKDIAAMHREGTGALAGPGVAGPPGDDLLSRLFLPARTMSLRLGAGAGIDERAPAGVNPLFLVNDTEMRWGFRPHLELSLPLALSGEVRTAFGQSVAGVALRSLFPSPSVSLSASQALPLGDDLVLAVQGSLDDIGAVQSVRVAAGALMRPFHALTVSPAVARIEGGGEKTPTIVVGGALRRGTVSAPLAELEVIEGLYVYESSALFFDQNPRGLSLRAHTHVLGLLLYF